MVPPVLSIMDNCMTSSTLVETVNINLEDFSETFLTCSTCLCQYDQETRKAKLLPCSHSVCLSCLELLSAHQQSQNGPAECLRCPMCREVCPLPSGGVTALPASFMINQLLDVMNRQRKDVVAHCAVHPEDGLLYCEGCDLVFCPLCQQSLVNKKCNLHTVIPFAIALKRMSEIALYRAKGRIRLLDQACACVEQEIKQLDENVDKIVDQINLTFQEVSHLVEARRRELIESVRIRRDEKRKVLRDQMESIDDEKKKLQKELESSEVDVRDMARRLKEFDADAERLLTEPRENAFLRLNTNSSEMICDVQRCLSRFGSLSASTTFPAQSIIEQTEPPTTFTETRLILKTFDVAGKPRVNGGDPIDITVETSGKCVPFSLKDNDDGTYDVWFRVAEPGDYTVSARIFGRQIKNSPYLVNVSSHHPPKWQLSVELNQPTRVCLKGDHIFYVLDTCNNRVRIVKDNGDVISDVYSSCLEGESAVGMALVDDDHIAVLNWKTKSVSRINHKGEVAETMAFSEFKEPIDLAIDRRGRYLIADMEKIFVFDPSFRPLFSFPGRQAQITCVNVGLNDDIIVGTTAGIQLFDGAGRFIREVPVSSDKKMRPIVSSCSACSESGQIVCGVIDSRTNKAHLAVSHYKGTFMYSLDSHGSRLRRPCGVSIADGQRDGQVFVVDHTCHSVRMYRYK